ncbi:MAG: SIMPL domain-containing protein [Syntrophobacteria bacterium]
MYRRFIVSVFGTLIIIIFACLAYAEEKPGPSTIEVTGKAKIMVMPNMATVSFAVETSATTAKQAAGENAEKTKKLLNALREITAKEVTITTAGFNLTPIYDKDSRLRPRGYRARNSVILETKSIDKLGTFIDEASRVGVSHSGSLSFSTDRDEELRKDAAGKALQQAQEIAENLAKAAGLTIKKIIKLSYSSAGPVRPYRMEAMAAAARTPIEVGEMSIEESVHVVFEAY